MRKPDPRELRSAILFVFALGIVAIGLSCGDSGTGPTKLRWVIQTVDSVGHVGGYTSLAVDNSGISHISYVDYSAEQLKYAFGSGHSWSIQTIKPGEIFGIGWGTSLALDRDQRPAISFCQNPLGFDYTGTLRFAQWNGSSWDVVTVDSTAGSGRSSSLAFDGNGNPYIAYWGQPARYRFELRLAIRNGVSWTISAIDLPGAYAGVPSLAIDAADNPHISYSEPNNSFLRHAYRTGGTWVSEDVDTTGSFLWYSSLTIERNGRLHIAYCVNPPDNLKYAYYDGLSWQVQTVDSAVGVGAYCAMVLNASGRPIISYQDYTNHFLKYARWNGRRWDIQVIDNTSQVGMHTDIALGTDGRPRISYYDNHYSDLRYTYQVEE